jgi:hypothetical protein
MLFRSTASREYPAFVPLMDEYLRLAESADSEAVPTTKVRTAKRTAEAAMHLFDMLRDKKLFPSNADLAEFAGRVLPGITRNRFEKISRSEIAARIIDYLDTKDRRTREELEESMRLAMASPSSTSPTNRRSFFSEWEKIIKGIQL